MKKIFIAATKQNDGKTTVCLGLIRNFQDEFKKVGFIKPIGQRYLEEEGLKIDEDSLLIEEVCGINPVRDEASRAPGGRLRQPVSNGVKCGLKDMSPIAVEKGFTEKYIVHPDKRPITRQIKNSFRRVSKGKRMVIIEGTGHAGVGSVFDHSNATVARLLGSKVIIISSGGIGRPIDEIVLNKALFEREGVKVLGAVINKVLPAKFDKINCLVRRGLERKGINVLGVIPYNPMLSRPTIEQILEETNFELLCGKDFLERPASRVIVGAMEPHDAIKYIVDDSLMITPGDREDMIMTALGCFRETDEKRLKVSGLILTGGIKPDQPIMNLLLKAQVPILISKRDTYDVANIIHGLTVKIRPRDTEKINTIVKLIKENIDFDRMMKGI